MVSDPLIAQRAAVGALELSTIARGIVALDQMVKRAENTVVAARTFSPGRYLIVLSGNLAEVEEAMAAGLEAAAEDRLDHLILHDPAADLRAALANALTVSLSESLLIVETTSVCSTLAAVDATLKGADVELLELRLGAGLGGKGVFTVTGSLPMIEAAKEIAVLAMPADRLLRVELIARPHPDLPGLLLGPEAAAVRGPR